MSKNSVHLLSHVLHITQRKEAYTYAYDDWRTSANSGGKLTLLCSLNSLAQRGLAISYTEWLYIPV